uniref:Zinc finger GRF-type domain-containing protein n=1 Tax=Lactuca sativa TaxID=4236 RepID=A0A9R1UJL3_LACSA|nr:hypothetical protein LSAT_V11C900482950 [Lactuca sativa]
MSRGSRISTGSSNHIVDKEVICDCKLPTRIRTSKTKDSPGKKFRECPNSLCKVWEWIDEEPENMKPIVEDTLSDVADYLIQVLKDVTSVREEVKKLKVMVCVPILLVIVKVMFWD